MARFLAPDDPPAYYEKVKAVFSGRLADPKVLLNQLHDTDTNSNESYNSMVNEGMNYRRNLCDRLGIEPPESMLVRDNKSARNDPLDRRFGYASGAGFDHDGRGQMLEDGVGEVLCLGYPIELDD
ncbi:hypothetical protein CYMTET_47541 [Cymbomonas tetramitiformis]|uniref:Uncharacterized protein n=1 Tax=Cymbomonas tetramitiformis TaxID=36881 RepID=A0AAE0BVI2_9CHLO|nr:hypothetical protein CYMTET_47541 [Cymbomonas tetramitiformis]